MKDKEQISIETYTYKDFKKGFEITDDPYNVGNYAKTPIPAGTPRPRS